MTITSPDETTFVVQAQKGDRVAFGELVKLYQKRAYAIAYSFVGNRDDALEIAQEAFVKAYGANARFDTDLPFFPLPARHCRNTSLTHQKDHNPPRRPPPPHHSSALSPTSPLTSCSPQQPWRSVGIAMPTAISLTP